MDALAAGFWGFVGGVSLLIGALIGLYVGVPQRVIATLSPPAAIITIEPALGDDLRSSLRARIGGMMLRD